MTASQVETDVAGRLLELAEALNDEPGFAEVVASLKAGHGATLGGIWGSSCALAAAAIESHAPESLVIICPRPGDIDTLTEDLRLFTSTPSEQFPAWETASREHAVDDQIHGDRLRVLKSLAGEHVGESLRDSRVASRRDAATCRAERPRLLVTSIQSLLQPVPARQLLAAQTRQLRVGDVVEVAELLRWFAANGFQNTPAVQLPGEFSVRGGIVDVFAPDWDEPVRIELFGDQVESIRQFEVSSQRSRGRLESLEITILKPSAEHRDHLMSYLPPGSWFFLVEPDEMQEEARHYLQRVRSADRFSFDRGRAQANLPLSVGHSVCRLGRHARSDGSAPHRKRGAVFRRYRQSAR